MSTYRPSRHATVKVGEYTIPLIGVPLAATEEKCCKCGGGFHLSEIMLDYDGNPLCRKCRGKAIGD